MRRLGGALLLAALAVPWAAGASLDDPPSRAAIRALLDAASAEAPPAVAPAQPAPLKPGDRLKTRVAKVLDADTLLVGPKGDIQIRLDGVDAPETAHPEHDKPGQPYGEEAAAFVRGLVEGKSVVVDIKEADKYGRYVGWVTMADGRALQHEMLRGGWAWWNFFFSKDEELNKLENAAIESRRGLWAGKERGGEYWPEAPWVFRRRVAAGVKRVLPGEEIALTVKHMPDADTAALGTRNSVYDYVRLAGIDAPEVSHGASRPGQPYGPEAGARAAELVAAEGMKIQVTVEDCDPYGRLVGWVRLPGRGAWLNEILLEEGWAWWYERYYPSLGHLGEKQAKAKAAKLGLWADPAPVPPWEFRRSQR